MILFEGGGIITIQLDKNYGREDFRDIPNFLGNNRVDSLGVSFKFANSKQNKYLLTINVSGSAFSEKKKSFICIDSVCHPFLENKMLYEFEVTNPTKLYMKSETSIAYIVMKNLDYKIVNDQKE